MQDSVRAEASPAIEPPAIAIFMVAMRSPSFAWVEFPNFVQANITLG
ncbi:hypothetical protein BSU04_23765 [Caballeronia sordidicola]|uniref:Uncharacterized protein n=1 Tax=Caballeronia sordidicola TaxID=196367 RepID=A0A226WY10_CABSO|nr:hypothetical protein BSU04_23765 [Caballeronia sordidicola]